MGGAAIQGLQVTQGLAKTSANLGASAATVPFNIADKVTKVHTNA